MLGQETPFRRTYSAAVRNFEKLALANVAALVCICAVAPAPVGLAMLLGVIEAAAARPDREAPWGAFGRGIRRYIWKCVLVWAAAVAAAVAGLSAVFFYVHVLAGKELLWMLGFIVTFCILLGLVFMFVLSQAVVDKLRLEGRLTGERVGFMEGLAVHFGRVLRAGFIEFVLVMTVIGFAAMGFAGPLLYLVESTGRPEE